MVLQSVSLPSSSVETTAVLIFCITAMESKIARILPMSWIVVSSIK